jgi:uncharacterized protein YbjT (DUF2867 family)
MRVLLTGANGFLGRYLLARVVGAGHEVIPAVRDPAKADRLLAKPAAIFSDLNQDTDPDIWLPRLEGIDAVINCAGILQGRPGQSIEAIHAAAPKALFAACRQLSVRRVIQISAISAETKAGTDYALTKKSADDFLAATDLDWVILRPSLVFADGANGGTALFRALAALPMAIPIVGDGSQPFQPIHVDDLTSVVLAVLETPAITRMVIDPVGPDRIVLKEMLSDLRRWLGFRPAPFVRLPLTLVRIAARIGDVVGGTMNSTSVRQLEFGNVGAVEPFVRATGIAPRRWRDALLARPAQIQDRWHSRLFFIRPLLRVAIALTWIFSGIAGLTRPPAEPMVRLLNTGVPTQAFAAACILDVAIGIAVLVRWRPATMALIQTLLVGFYSIVLTIIQPSLWLEPLGPMLKNLPFVAAVLALAAIEPDR